ncbi:hypothetical protein GUJ93_ZPchr0012g19760 [Zizania palustris]|uniref:Uncharacterized protein n=1 Tax=Zizania palustris TaxID=103762 RepID=A0A8J6BSK2_ZIZPA|nr:hypothetical protein GUJ93_ZPchr0012g19760 [Zizania palustris]
MSEPTSTRYLLLPRARFPTSSPTSSRGSPTSVAYASALRYDPSSRQANLHPLVAEKIGFSWLRDCDLSPSESCQAD